MFCIKCGQKIPDNSLFCPKCGSSVKRPVNQANPNYTHPNSPYGRQPRGGYQANVYRPQKAIHTLGEGLLVVAGIWVLLRCAGRILVLIDCIGYLRYIQVLGYEFLVVYAAKISCIAASIFGGIRGIAYCGKPEKGKAVALNGIIIAALSAADWISVTTLTKGLIDEFAFTWKDVVLGLIPPIFLAISGVINHKALKKAKGGRKDAMDDSARQCPEND